jgi:hypothetical protein
MKITALEESADFATLDTEKLSSKAKSHELSRKSCHNHDASFTSKALITNAHVGGHDANLTNTISSSLEFTLPSLAVDFDGQYESIPDDEIACLQGNFGRCTSFRRRGEEAPKTLGAALSAVTPPTSSPSTPRGRSTTTATRMTRATRTTTKRRIASETRRRTSRRSCVEHL